MARRQEPSECMAFSPDDTWIACGAGNATTYDGMQLSGVQTGQLLIGRQKIVSLVTFSPALHRARMTHKLTWRRTSHCGATSTLSDPSHVLKMDVA